MTQPDDKMGSQTGHVTSARGRSCTCLDCDERSRDQFEIPFRHPAASCWSIFSLTKENWSENVSPHWDSPAQTLTSMCNSSVPVEFPFAWGVPLCLGSSPLLVFQRGSHWVRHYEFMSSKSQHTRYTCWTFVFPRLFGQIALAFINGKMSLYTVNVGVFLVWRFAETLRVVKMVCPKDVHHDQFHFENLHAQFCLIPTVCFWTYLLC